MKLSLSRNSVARLIRFGLVGGSGVVVNLVIYRLFLWGLPTTLGIEAKILVANFFGVLVSIFTNFLLNDRWTWGDRDKGEGRWFSRLATYYLSASVAGGVQLAVTSLSYDWVWRHAPLDIWGHSIAPDIALLTGIGCGMAINFAVSHTWTFRDA
jgi:putative flippase GtrA